MPPNQKGKVVIHEITFDWVLRQAASKGPDIREAGNVFLSHRQTITASILTSTMVCTCQVNPSAPWWLGPCVAHTKGLLAFAMLYQPPFSAACEQKWPLLGEVKVNSRNEPDSQSTKIQNKQTNRKGTNKQIKKK